MKIYKTPSPSDKESILIRPNEDFDDMKNLIDEVFYNVKENGDKALIDYALKFDKVAIKDLAVSGDELRESSKVVSSELKEAIDMAYSNIYKFHEAQKKEGQKIETTPGVVCWQKSYPIDPIGLYIPGGTAPLFSTVMMLGIPAKIAGCKDIVLCSPPQKQGNIHPATLYAAQICGITKIFKVGGSQAIAAMTLGTESIPKVNKLFGPGNQYVTAAKQNAIKYGVAIDLPAGPTEVLVYADESGIPEFIAADLLSQAEHGADSQVILVTKSVETIDNVMVEIEKQVRSLPRREIVELCIANSAAIVLEDVEKAFDFINSYAPEHLIIASDHAEDYVPYIQNAGSVFLGNYSPESAGDYASGTNHTLPTGGFAKSYSGTNLDAFVKQITFQHLSKKGIQNLGNTIMTMARAERLEAHARSVDIRLK